MKKVKQGFTFIELLVSIAILGSLVGLLSSTLQNSTYFFEKTNSQFEQNRLVRIIANQMQQDFQSVIYLINPTDIEKQSGNSGIVGVSSAERGVANDQVQMHVHNFSNIVFEPQNDAEIQKVSYIVFNNIDDDFFTLVRRESYLYFEQDFNLITTNYYDEQDQFDNQNYTFDAVLSKRVKSFNVQYYGSINNKRDWFDDWNSNAQKPKHRIPEFVKVELEIADKQDLVLKHTFNFLVRPPLGENINWKI